MWTLLDREDSRKRKIIPLYARSRRNQKVGNVTKEKSKSLSAVASQKYFLSIIYKATNLQTFWYGVANVKINKCGLLES